MTELLQVVGAVFILIAFAAIQRGALAPHQFAYLALNLAGGIVLTYVAVAEQDWGFLLLEVVWSIVSAWGLLGLARKEKRPRRGGAVS
ncbi:MAG: hypothetical protein JW895_18105 [Thermoleophilaceae bacterium]|nr:hypothetical protein [Thermoleophilaceae bacterium]